MQDLINSVDENNVDGIKEQEVGGVIYTPFETLMQYIICKYLKIPANDVIGNNLDKYKLENTSDVVGSYHVKDYLKKGYDKNIVNDIVLWYMYDKIISKKFVEDDVLAGYSTNASNFIVKFEELVGGLVNRVTGSITTIVQADFANLPMFLERRKEILKLANEDAIKHSDLIETKIAELEELGLQYLKERPEHPLSVAIKSGVYNNLQAIKSFVIVGKQSLEGVIQPYPVVNGYFNGFTSPIELVNEISSAKTANKYSLLFVAFTEKFSKEFQFNVPNEPVTQMDDCGCTTGVKQMVTQQTMGNDILVNGKWVETHRYNIHQYIGKEWEVRLPHNCNGLKQGKICKRCIGIMSKQHPRATNILFTLTSSLNEGISQTVLKTKHFIASAENSNKGRIINDEHFRWSHNELIAKSDMVIYITANEVSALIFDEQGSAFDSYEDIMIDDTDLSRITKYLTEERVVKDGIETVTLVEHTVSEPMSINKKWLDKYLKGTASAIYNDADEEIEDELIKYFGDVFIPIQLNIKAGEPIFVFKEKTEDIKKVSDEIIGLFSLPNESKKLKALGIDKWVERQHGTTYLKREHYDDFYHRIVAIFQKVGGISNTVLSACIAILSVDENGDLGDKRMKSFKGVLRTGFMSSMARSETSDPYKGTNFLSAGKTIEPMDNILEM